LIVSNQHDKKNQPMQDLFVAANDSIYFKQFRISDLLFTEYKCMAESSVFDIWSRHNYFVYVMTGKLQWNTQKAEYLVYSGEMIFVKKGGNIIHKFFDESFCALLIFMPDDYIKEVAKLEPSAFTKVKETNSDSVIPIKLDGTLHTYFQSLTSYFFRAEAPSAVLLEVKFKELLLNIISSGEHQNISSYFKSLFYTTKTSIPAIMEANYIYNLSLEEFARLCGRSLSVFKNDFREIYHCSPGRWLTQKRLEYARELLLNSDKTVNELILECGFENASHFSRVFKEKFGTTPVKYRN
jgi:AraC family transcriptional regulator, exoenzyme S synthesis regulatory protein ExsA